MNRLTVLVLIAIISLSLLAGLLFADPFAAHPKLSKETLKKLAVITDKIDAQLLEKNVEKKLKRSMPSFTPDPNIDYKIQRMAVDNSIDYKILDAGPHKPVPDDLRPNRRIIRPFNFRFPKSTLNLNTGTPEKAAEKPPGTKRHKPSQPAQKTEKE